MPHAFYFEWTECFSFRIHLEIVWIQIRFELVQRSLKIQKVLKYRKDLLCFWVKISAGPAFFFFSFPVQPASFLLLVAQLGPIAGPGTLTGNPIPYLVTRPKLSLTNPGKQRRPTQPSLRPHYTWPLRLPRLCLGYMSCSASRLHRPHGPSTANPRFLAHNTNRVRAKFIL
jgi:hypothetical protein